MLVENIILPAEVGKYKNRAHPCRRPELQGDRRCQNAWEGEKVDGDVEGVLSSCDVSSLHANATSTAAVAAGSGLLLHFL